MRKPPKPQRLVEEEVAPGRILFGPGRRQWLALLGTVFGLGGAGAILTSTAGRNANAAAVTATGGGSSGALNLLMGGQVVEWHGPPLFGVLPSGRQVDPTP
ncbi:MAG: hypothetical protein AVDCRST_MAG85-389 [uncultured Solirubrobacteraceae bacterium]|uniref:Uncharacterized protein n=1 Tax=uncultured Solirubrobacteraceae bacterium TaxID=1162706 RepID=A0A6J4RM79_9ACTN|nr:MAG: hypothetical protein AVDCRST_MAG85-389 [uncultured Solirubrobacteraceae bacterium]